MIVIDISPRVPLGSPCREPSLHPGLYSIGLSGLRLGGVLDRQIKRCRLRPRQLVESLDEIAGERAGLAVADVGVKCEFTASSYLRSPPKGHHQQTAGPEGSEHNAARLRDNTVANEVVGRK